MEITEHFADNLANLTESELWQVPDTLQTMLPMKLKAVKHPINIQFSGH